jgi:hypothetical protein
MARDWSDPLPIDLIMDAFENIGFPVQQITQVQLVAHRQCLQKKGLSMDSAVSLRKIALSAR